MKLCLADGYADATYLRLVLKNKGHAGIFVFGRTDGRATGGADPNATCNWCYVKADGVYFYCFSMIVHGFAEATTDTICVFYFFTETSILSTQNLYFDAVRRQATK